MSDTWTLGFGLAYESSDIDAEDLSETEGDQVQAGMIGKGRFGPTTISVAVSGGMGFYDTDRLVAPGIIARSDQEVTFVAGHLRASYLFEPGPNWYWLPMIDLGITHFMFSDFTETGAGGLNLIVMSQDHDYFTVQPAVEIGGEMKVGEEYLLRPYIKIGLTQFVGDTAPEISAILQGAPAGLAPFILKGEVDKTFGDIDVGATLFKGDLFNLRLNYIGQFNSDVQSHGGSLKVTIPF